mgnify:CR=1 FL=1
MTHDWMRQDAVNILDYLPRFLGMDPNFHATNHADSKEHDRIRLLLQDLLNQVYVDTVGLAALGVTGRDYSA